MKYLKIIVGVFTATVLCAYLLESKVFSYELTYINM